jgi:23S rRNA (cytosine1962-C5)-methyltransferase
MEFENYLDRALNARDAWQPAFLDGKGYESAWRLFNGFTEGHPEVAIDLYGQTLVIFQYHTGPDGADLVNRAAEHLLKRLPWIQAVIVKTREAQSEQERRGVFVFGHEATRKIREHGAWYALDLTLNLDASLYLDTRELRAWAIERLAGKRVLNTFAYTGSLGVAAMAGGARQVIQLDLSRRFLDLARKSYALNGFAVNQADFIAGDFWTEISRLKRAKELFDCVLVDPPFFSQTGRGRVDLVTQFQRVINKVRPLVGHGGALVAINNALFLSGQEYLRQLEELCASGYMTIEEMIPVPPDFTGFPETRTSSFPADPAPFNHPTKIAVLRVTRKDLRSA